MENKILVLTDKSTGTSEKFVGHNIDVIKEIDNDKYALHNIENNWNSYLLCIIVQQATVLELLRLVIEVKKFYSLPICIFETDIIEKYPGEKDKLKGKIDIMIQRSLSKLDFFQLISNFLELSEKGMYRKAEEKIEVSDSNRKILIYPNKRVLYIDNTEVNLTKKEFDIFIYLFQKEGAVVSHKELYEMVWKREYLHDDTNIMAHIHRLRGKVEEDPKKPKYICNQHGVGYYFGGLFQETLPTL